MAKMFAVENDPYLPALQKLVDSEFMQQLFTERLENVDRRRFVIERVRPVEFRYRPGKRCEIIYRVRYAFTDDSGWDKHFFSALILPGEAAKQRFEQERHKLYVMPAFGPAIQFFEDLGLIIWGFPNDPKMAGLRQFLQPEFLKRYVAEHAEKFGLPPSAEIQFLNTSVVKYVPQDRCTLRHELRWRQNGRAESMTFFSKLFNDKFDSTGSYETLQALYRSDVCQRGALLFPQPILHDARRNAIVQYALQGAHLPDDFFRLDLHDFAYRCGMALAGLQQARVPTANFRSRRGVLLEVTEGMQDVSKRHPELLPDLQQIRSRLEQELADLPELPRVSNHGAFRMTQMLRVGNRLGLVDFDGVLLADPMLDAGSFVAHLLYLVVKNELPLEKSLQAIRAFSRGYREMAPWGMPAEVLRWFVAGMLISKHAKKCIRLGKKHQDVRVERLVELAEEVMNQTIAFDMEHSEA
ncbi:MAG: aminoglycoside phosphotransferase family protein [candidate division KSB1 bacterium]|nr:aminoglycoside phosphotransferase family protein [candidate division KSB1 bacterium]